MYAQDDFHSSGVNSRHAVVCETSTAQGVWCVSAVTGDHGSTDVQSKTIPVVLSLWTRKSAACVLLRKWWLAVLIHSSFFFCLDVYTGPKKTIHLSMETFRQGIRLFSNLLLHLEYNYDKIQSLSCFHFIIILFTRGCSRVYISTITVAIRNTTQKYRKHNVTSTCAIFVFVCQLIKTRRCQGWKCCIGKCLPRGWGTRGVTWSDF